MLGASLDHLAATDWASLGTAAHGQMLARLQRAQARLTAVNAGVLAAFTAQRKLVWTLDEKQKLVESVLRKFPILAILLAERDSGSYEIIDGLQRLHTLISFIETAFPALDDKYFDIAQFPTPSVVPMKGTSRP